MPQHGRVRRGQVGPETARRHHAPVSPGGGGKTRRSAFYTRALQSDRLVRTDLADLLPGTAGSEPEAIPAVAPDAAGASRPSGERPDRDNRDRNRHAVRFLATRTVCRRIQGAVRGITLHDTR